jgi:hypothetical protein
MPLVTNGTLQRTYEQLHRPGQYLGRNLELDSRSLGYLLDPALAQQPIKPAEWAPPIPTLDQGQTGSCTGNAGTYHLATLLGASRLSEVRLDGYPLTPNDAARNEEFARQLYHHATIEDGFQGTWPPDDTGSSGLGVCRSLKKAGLIPRYVWATTSRGMASFLQRSGCIIGMPWMEAFFQTDRDGFIDHDPNWYYSGVAGGHEVYVEALEKWDEHDMRNGIIRFHNSWTDGWGDHGRGRMRISTYERLRAEIDCKQFALA